MNTMSEQRKGISMVNSANPANRQNSDVEKFHIKPRDAEGCAAARTSVA